MIFHEEVIDEYSNTLDETGVVVIPNVFSPEQIETFIAESQKAFEKVKVTVENSTGKQRDYITAFDKVYHNRKYYYDDHEGNPSIIELAKGRYDFGLNGNHGIFASDSFLNPEPIKKLMKTKLGTQYTTFAGAVPAVPQSDDGLWHRDIYPLFDNGEELTGSYDDSIEVKIMPPFYYTLLIPLGKMTANNGATEFIPGSHRLTYEEAKDIPRFQSDIEVGSVLLFDGRVFHRGRANQTNDSRMVLYQVYNRKWYNDY